MNKNQIVATKFQAFAKYSRLTAIITVVLYFIFATISTGQGYMVLITYTLLILSIVSAFQWIVSLVLTKIYQKK